MIRLIALDLDGTLLDSSFQVSEANTEAVHLARERGVHIVLNTARWYGLAQRTARRLGLRTPLICHNGAHVREPDGGGDLLHEQVPVDAAREIAAFCDEKGFETYTTVDGITYMRSRWDAEIDPKRLPKDMVVARSHAERIAAPATGIIVFSGDGVRGVVDALGERYRDGLTFSEAWSETAQPYLTITAAGCDKGRALRLVCEHLGVPPEETMAVGDAEPDVAMFELARIGVAMGNAPDGVQAQADAVAPVNTDGGVAWAIKRYVLETG